MIRKILPDHSAMAVVRFVVIVFFGSTLNLVLIIQTMSFCHSLAFFVGRPFSCCGIKLSSLQHYASQSNDENKRQEDQLCLRKHFAPFVPLQLQMIFGRLL